MNSSIILDIETLSRRPNAIIIEIGVVAFNRDDFEPIDSLELFPGFFEQIQSGRHLCNETIQFHQKNGTLPAQVGDQPPADSMRQLAAFIRRYQPHRIWIQGPDFDRPIIESLCQDVGQSLPWDYWRTRDARTIWDAAFPGIKHDPRPHRALSDCKATLNDLARALNYLNRRQAA